MLYEKRDFYDKMVALGRRELSCLEGATSLEEKRTILLSKTSSKMFEKKYKR